jgi:hypothetical protein
MSSSTPLGSHERTVSPITDSMPPLSEQSGPLSEIERRLETTAKTLHDMAVLALTEQPASQQALYDDSIFHQHVYATAVSGGVSERSRRSLTRQLDDMATVGKDPSLASALEAIRIPVGLLG